MIERRYTTGSRLDRPVLVLNRLWQAINVCTVRRAVVLLCCEHAQVVDELEGVFSLYGFEDWCTTTNGTPSHELIHSVSLALRQPKIIVLTTFDQLPRKEVCFSRSNVFSRDHHTCQYCRQRFERRELNIDHVIPRVRGGKTSWTNIVCCCLECNRVKGSRTPAEAGMYLLREPIKPRWQPFLEVQFAQCYDESWQHFLDPSGWDFQLGES